jgi:hypothetical protein
VCLVHEIFHTIKNKNEGKEQLCALKLDIHKAYDRVEWVFLEHMISRFGFHSGFVELLMACVQSVKYKV